MRTVCLLVLVAAVLAVHLSHEQLKRDGDVMVGGYGALDVGNLSDDGVQVDQYFRKVHADMAGARLVAASRQVVAGFNYRYKYQLNQTKGENKTWDLLLYRDLKDNLIEREFTYTVTLPNGEEIKAIGDPASVFVAKTASAVPNQSKIVESASTAVPAQSKSFSAQPNRSSFPNYIEFVPK